MSIDLSFRCWWPIAFYCFDPVVFRSRFSYSPISLTCYYHCTVDWFKIWPYLTSFWISQVIPHLDTRYAKHLAISFNHHNFQLFQFQLQNISPSLSMVFRFEFYHYNMQYKVSLYIQFNDFKVYICTMYMVNRGGEEEEEEQNSNVTAPFHFTLLHISNGILSSFD